MPALVRHFLVASTLSLSLLVPFALPLARAQETAIPEVANSKQTFIGKINADGVNVRSGPGDNYYATLKLDKDAEVTVMGIKFDWLKITPPKGSFSYVAKAFVERSGEKGIVSREEVNIRTGSALNQMKTSIQARLNKGQEVQIIGEQDEYYKIAPPADAYVYVNKQFVEPVRALNQLVQAPTGGQGQDQTQGAQPKGPEGLIHEPGQPIDPNQNTEQAKGPTTGPADELPFDRLALDTKPGAGAGAGATTQPTSEVLFDKLEADFADASTKTIEQQPIKELLEGYNKILADSSIPESLKRIADTRVRTLTARNEVKDQFVESQRALNETKKRQQALKVEQEELTASVKKSEVKMFAAVGELRTSSFQNGQTTLYRLIDPATLRSVVYIRSNDNKYAALIGQFIGVKGDVATESGLNMKVITPTEDAIKVNPEDVFKKVAAQIVPPSILPQAAQQASTEGQ